MSLKNYYELIGEIAGIEPPKRKMSYSVSLIFGYFLQLISIVTREPPPITPSTVRMNGSYAYYDCFKLSTNWVCHKRRLDKL